jgi:hypothetical protein
MKRELVAEILELPVAERVWTSGVAGDTLIIFSLYVAGNTDTLSAAYAMGRDWE